MLGKGLESLIPSGGYKKPDEGGVPANSRPENAGQPSYQPPFQSGNNYPTQVPMSQGHQSSSYPQSFPEQARPQAYAAPEPQVPVNQGYQSGYGVPQSHIPEQAPTYVAQPYQQPIEPRYEAPAVPVQQSAYHSSYGEPRLAPESSYRSVPEQFIPTQPTQPERHDQAPAFPAPRNIIPEENRDLSLGQNAPRDVLDDYSTKQAAVFQIEVEKIFPNPHQPRRYFDEGALNDLANSIREFGIIQPLVVTKVLKETENGTDVNYQLIAGERRLLAARKVGLRTVPAVVKQVLMDRERLELAIIENIQRENLNPLEAARSYARLQDEFGLTQREIAIRMGKSRETIANTLRLLNLPSEVQQALEEGRINESHARLLLQVTDQAKQREMFNSILHFKPSVRELKAKLRQDKSIPGGAGYINPELSSLQSRLEEVLGTRVQISDEGEKGRIMISYYSPEELNDLINKLSGGTMY